MGTKNPSENTEFKNVTIIKVCLLKIEIEISYCPRVILTGFTNTSYKLICFIAYFVFLHQFSHLYIQTSEKEVDLNKNCEENGNSSENSNCTF